MVNPVSYHPLNSHWQSRVLKCSVFDLIKKNYFSCIVVHQSQNTKRRQRRTADKPVRVNISYLLSLSNFSTGRRPVRACSGVERIDPLRFLVGHVVKGDWNQALFVQFLSIGFLSVFCWLSGPLFVLC